ncbi:MAG: aspartate 1-decarboxylase [Thermoleophilia bacterium]
MLKSKLHRATVTAASIDYEGSITVDRELMAAADIFEYEQVHVLDVTNGHRLVTYVIRGGPGEICVNGAAARLVNVGDIIILASYGDLEPKELPGYSPTIVLLDEHNRIVRRTAPVGAATSDEEGRQL